MPGVVQASVANQQIANASGDVMFKISSNGDAITGGIGDTFAFDTGYAYYNSITDISGGQIVAGVDNAFIGLDGNFSAATNGITAIAGNGYSGVTVSDDSAVLNLSGVALSDVAIAANQTAAQTITSTSAGMSYTVSGNNATLNAAGHDTFTVKTAYNFYNTYNEPTGGVILAGFNNAFIGMAGNVVAGDGIAAILGNGYSGAMVGGNGAVFDLSGVRLSDVTINANQNNQTVTTTQGNASYQASGNGDIFNGVGGDTFTVKTAYNYDNTYNDRSGGSILGGFNNAVIGFTGNFSAAATGIDAISGNGYSGVTLSATGAVLNLTGVALSDVTVNANQNGQTITAAQTGLNFFVAANGDAIDGAGGDIFTVKTAYNYFNSYNDVSGGSIQAGFNNAVIGLAGNFSAGANGIASISGNGYSGVAIAGDTAGATLDFSQTSVSDATIRGGANNVAIIAPGGNQTLTGGGQSDVFAFTASTGNDAITDFRAGNGAGYDVIDLNGSLSAPNFTTLMSQIQQVGANAVITLNNGGAITLDNVSVASLKANNFNLSNLVSGLSAANGALTIGHGQSIDPTSTLGGLITQGKLDGVSTATTLTGLSAIAGAASVAAGDARYTAPASGNDTLTYTAEDQFGDLVSGKLMVTVDAGPTAATGALTTDGGSVDVTATLKSLITAGIAGDSETITGVSGNATLNANGSVTYTPTSAASSSFTYTVADEYGDSATGTVNVTQLQPAPVILTHANTVVNLSGNNDVVQGPASPTTGSNVTITAFGYDNTIVAGGGNDTIYAGLDGAHVTVSDANGGNDVSDALATLANNALIVLGNGNDEVSLRGYSNTITLGNGNNTVNAGVGYEKVTLGNGANSVRAGGYGNTISVGDGGNVIAAGIGNNIVTVAGGSATVSASGFDNSITTGAGNSTINAGAGYDTVSVGTGANTIVAAGNANTITTSGGSDSIVLSGWNNVVNAGSGLTVVAGGYENTYNLTTLGSSGGLQIADFNAPYGDVLNLDAALKPLAVGGVSLSSLVSASASGNDLLISVATAGGLVQAADLKGLASASLTGLIASHNIVL